MRNNYTEEQISIMMEDHCTRNEAIKHLNNGSIIYEADEWLEQIVEDYGYYDGSEDQETIADCETIDELRELVYADKLRENGLSSVSYDGKLYVISYCL